MMLLLLGRPRWQLAPDQHPRPLTAVEAVLLYQLAVQGPRDRASLAARLWPDSEPRLAQSNLRQRVFRLRRMAGAGAIVGDATLALSTGIAVDVRDPETALVCDPLACQGRLLDGIDWPDDELRHWIDSERELWRLRLARCLTGLASRTAAEGNNAAALPYAERLVQEWPDDDTAHHRLMQLHYLNGDSAAALEVYRRCEVVLMREDQRRPSPQVCELAAKVTQAMLSNATGRSDVPVAMLRPLRLVGRDAEWQRLEVALRSRRSVLVSGEPGVGKSRLIGDFAAAHRSLQVSARPGDKAVLYSTLGRLLLAIRGRCGEPTDEAVRAESARIAPWIAAVATGPTYSPPLHRALRQWFTHAGDHGVSALVVDDLQYADAASIEVILDATTEACVPWVMAVRSAEWPPQLVQWLQASQSDGVQTLHLGPLDAAIVADLLIAADVPQPRAAWMAQRLWQHTGGNPYFVLQTLLAAGPALPEHPGDADWAVAPHLRELVERRLNQLGADALLLAQVMALADIDFSVALAAKMLDRSPLQLAPAWRELERAHLVRGLSFAHDIAREATLALVPQPIRDDVHRQLATLGPGISMPVARQAAHWLAAGEDRAAAAALLQAAEAARHLSRRTDEATLLDQAIGCLQRLGDDPAQLFDAIELRLQAARYADSYDTQLALLNALDAAAGRPEQRCRSLIAAAALHSDGIRFDAALAASEAAAALADTLGHPVHQRAAARQLARALMGLARNDDAVRVALQHRGSGLAAGDLDAARYLNDLAMVLIRASRPREAWPLLQRARATAASAADWGLLAEVLWSMGYLLHQRAQARRAWVYYQHARRSHARTGSSYSVSMLHFVGLPRLCRELGRYAESLDLFEAIQAEQRASSAFRAHTVNDADLSFLWLQLGQPGRALQVLGPDDRPPPGSYVPSWLIARARIDAWAGRPATTLLKACFDEVTHESTILRWLAGRDLAMSLPAAEGIRLARAMLDECGKVDCENALWPLRIALCERLTAHGSHSLAAEQARLVLQAFRHRVIVSFYPPHAWWIVGCALRACGDDTAAREAFGQGLRWIHAALQNVPEAYRSSFLHRNPWNRLLRGLPPDLQG